jgi:hypothetical protein
MSVPPNKANLEQTIANLRRELARFSASSAALDGARLRLSDMSVDSEFGGDHAAISRGRFLGLTLRRSRRRRLIWMLQHEGGAL